MDNREEINAALDELEIENDVIEGEVIEEVVEVEEEPEVNDDPPGFINNLDDWVAAGKDPDLFKGKKAYTQEYARIQEVKELKSMMKEVVSTTAEWKSKQQDSMDAQIAQAREDAKRDLKQAKDEDDIDGALAAQEKLQNLKPEAPETPKQSPVLGQFFKENPILDKQSGQYSEEFYQDMSMAQSTILNQLTGGNPRVSLTDAQVKRSLTLAYSRTKELYPDKFKSARNSRRGGSNPAPKRGTTTPTGDYSSRLKAMNIPSKNNQDQQAQNDIYEMIKAKDPKRAEAYAKTLLGE